MKVATIAVVFCVVVFCGCSANRAYRPSVMGGSGAGSAPDSTPSLGNPSSILPGQGNSSSYGPSGGSGGGSGPSLSWPEATQDLPASRSRLSRKLSAPDPKEQVSRYRPEKAAEPVSSADRPSLLDEPSWSRFYRSTDRRPIETVILGSGSTHIAILASLHGDETQSVSLVEELARTLRTHPEYLRQATVLLVKSPNPDGFFSRSPYNINGVDLNRNFPSENWKELRGSRAGNKSASEAETRVVMRLLGDFRPSLLVHLKDSRNGGVVNYEGNIQSRADEIANMISLQVVRGLGEKTSGSMESYVFTRLSCPSLTLLLAHEESDEAAWARNRDALLALLQETRTAPAADEADDSPDAKNSSSFNDQPDPFEEPTIQKSSLRRQRPAARNPTETSAKGRTRAPLPDFPAPVPDHGYLELPPP